MCKEQRATFSKAVIEDNGTSETYYSANIKRRTAMLGLVAVVVAIATGMLTLRTAVIDGIRDVAGQEFRQQLDTFHNVAKPEIYKVIDTKVELHHRASEIIAVERTESIRGDINAIKGQITDLKQKSDHQTELLEELLRRK